MLLIRAIPFVLILQGFCLYHAYTNNAPQKWSWLIIFLPVVGCALYLYHHFYSRQNVDNITEGLKGMVDPGYEVAKLEKKVKHSDTVQNKTRLADKYVELGRYREAVVLYESCLEGYNQSDPATEMKLVKANYLEEDFESAVYYGDQLSENIEFGKSGEKVAYAWSLYQVDKIDQAEKVFLQMDIQYINYIQRMEYGRFLHKIGKRGEALSHLQELMEEYDQKEPREKRLVKSTNQQISSLYHEIKSES